MEIVLQDAQKANVLKSEREQELVNKVVKLQEELTNTMGQNLVLKNNQVSILCYFFRSPVVK
jgi:hypothetical protein